MSTSIEQRVVQMKFDNKQFEAGTAQSMSTLDKLKAKLNFKGAAKGFEAISEAADKVSLNNLVTQTDEVGSKFDTLAIIAISALNRITNEAISAGAKLVKSLSIDQVASGWSKYEARTAAVQTLVNATGKSVEDIEKYMDKLMLYSDETSYGFADMTSSLATMVSAGGDINKLVPLLEGFGNAVSFVGKGAAEYSRAVIQLSQGYGRNALMLEDWKSIEQTLGGAKQLKQVFIDVGEELGKIRKGELDIGTFNESLRTKWLDQSVMEEALGRFGEMTERAFAMIEAGEAENVADAYEILSQSVDDYRIKAAKAAQEAKSFTEAIDATKDAVSTKWMESFQIIFGNYEEATKLWTELTNTLWDLFAASGDVRNEILKVWKDLGGRDEMILAIKAAFEALYKPMSAVSDAIHDIFFGGSVDEKGTWLYKATVRVKEFFETLILSDEACNTLRTAFKALLLPVQVVVQALRVAGAVATGLIRILFSLANTLLTLPSKFDIVTTALRRLFGNTRYERMASALNNIFQKFGDAVTRVGKSIGEASKTIGNAFSSRLIDALKQLVEALSPIGGWILDRIVDGFEILASFDYGIIADGATVAINALINGFKVMRDWCSIAAHSIKNFITSVTNMSIGEILDLIASKLTLFKDGIMNFVKGLDFSGPIEFITSVLLKLGSAIQYLISKLTPAKILVFAFGTSIVWLFMNLASAIAAFKGIAGSVTGVLDAFSERIKGVKGLLAGSPILQVAIAIGVLAVSLHALSQIDSDKLVTATTALAALLILIGGLVGAMAVITKFVVNTDAMTKNFAKVSQSMVLMAGSVALLSSALYILSKVNMEGMLGKIVALTAMMAILVVSMRLLSKQSKKDIFDSLFILAFAASLNMMVTALSKIGAADLSGCVANLAVMLIVIGLMVAVSKMSKNIKFSSAVGMVVMVGAIILFAKAIQPLANLDFGSMIQALLRVLVLVGTLALINKAIGKNNSIKDIGNGMVALSAGLLLMYVAIKKIGELDTGVIVKGTLTIGALLIFIGVMNDLSNSFKMNGDKDGKKTNTSFLGMAAAILVLGLAIDYIGGLEISRIIKGTAAVGALMLFLSILAKASATTEKATGALIAMTVCIGIVIAAVALLSLIDTMELIGASASMAIAFAGLAAMFQAVEKVSIGKALSSILLMIGAMATIGLLFSWMSQLERVDSLLTIAESLGIVMVSLGASLAIISKGKNLNKTDFGSIGKTLLLMAGVTAAAGVVIGVLGALPVGNQIIEKATALGIVLLGISAAIRIIHVKTATLKNTGKTLLLMAGMLVEAGVVIGVLGALPVGNQIIEKATALGITLLAMASAMRIMKIDEIDPASTTTALITMAGMLVEAGVVIGVLGALPVGNQILEKAVALSAVLLAMSGAIAIISSVSSGLLIIGASGPAAIKGAVMAMVVVTALGAVAIAVGALFEHFEGLDNALTKAEEVIPRLGLVIGEFISNIVGGLVGGFSGGVVEAFGTSLSHFADNIKGFLEIQVDQTVVDSIARLAEAVLIITGAEFINAILKFAGQDSMRNFGHQLAEFGPYFADFANSVAGIKDKEAVKVSAECLLALSDVLANIPTEGGIWGAIFGNKNLDSFGSGLSTLAQGIVDYSTIISTGNGVNEENVRKTNNIADMLIALTNKLPTTGGLVTYLSRQDMGEFGQQLVTFAIKLKSFFAVTSGMTVDQAKVTAIKKASDLLVELAKTVPNTGVLVDFLGGKDIGKFGSQIGEFGSGIASFFTSITEANLDSGMVQLAKEAGMAFVEISNGIGPNTGVSTWWESTSLETFGKQIKKLGEGLYNFYEEVADIKWNKVTSATTSINTILDMGEKMRTINSDSVTTFNAYLTQLAETGLDAFVDAFSNSRELMTETVYQIINSSLISVKRRLKKSAVNYSFVSDAIIAGISDAEPNVIARAVEVCKSFYDTILTESHNFEDTGSLIVSSMIDGVESKTHMLEMSLDNIMTLAIKAANKVLDIKAGYSEEFKKLGKYSIAGFIKGIDDNKSNVFVKISQLGDSIVSSLQNSLSVHSPSEKFAEIGMYTVLGFTKGVDENISTAKRSIVKMGETILNSMLDFWGINSPSTVARDEVGRYIIRGIADGITNDMSAEEAASKKAQNIINAFQSEFDKWSLDTSTADLEFKLWQALNPDASDSEVSAKQKELLNKKLQYQAERVNAASAQYQATIKALGENSEETQKAYNTYLQEQITMAQLAAELYESGSQTLSDQDEYYIRMSEQGLSDDAIRKQFAKDLNQLTGGAGGVTDIIDDYMSKASGSINGNVEVILQQVMPSVTQSGYTAGTTYANGMAQGITENGDPVTKAIEKFTGIDLTGDGENTGTGFLDGINKMIKNGGNTLTNGVTDYVVNPLLNYLQIKSPSQLMYNYGEYTVEGFVNGIDDKTPMAENSSIELAIAVTNAVEDLPNDWMTIGNNMSLGMANGILENQSDVINAAIQVAVSAITASRAALDINSPSRVYYEIGEMMDQGLANGIIDNTSVVEEAVRTMLSRVQGGIDSNPLTGYITPVIEDSGKIHKISEYGSKATDYMELLRWDAAGNLIPEGFLDTSGESENGRWWIASTEMAKAIRELGDKEAERAAYEQANRGQFEGTISELKSAIEELSSKDSISYTQNNYSPTALNSSTIYRNTKTALAKTSAAVSPIGRSIRSDT